MGEGNQAGPYEKVILGLDKIEPGQGVKFITAPAFVAGIGAGFGAYHVVKEGIFPANDQYEALQGDITEAQQRADTLIDAMAALRQEGISADFIEASQAASKYQAEVAQKREQLPGNYNPTWEGTVSGLSAIATGACVFIGLSRYVNKKAAAIRNKS